MTIGDLAATNHCCSFLCYQLPANSEKKPRALHRTHSIFMRNLPPSVTKQEIVNLCKRFPGFIRVAFSNPLLEDRAYVLFLYCKIYSFRNGEGISIDGSPVYHRYSIDNTTQFVWRRLSINTREVCVFAVGSENFLFSKFKLFPAI